jgi:hypothetical protein
VPSGHWNILENQREFFENMRKKYSLKNLNDFTKISNQKVVDEGGSAILFKYKNSLFQTLSSIYPEHQFDATEFLVNKFNSFLLKSTSILQIIITRI